MKEKRRPFFPILLKVILLGIITSFIASTIAIIVNYNHMINRAMKDLDESANDALEYAYRFYDNEAEDNVHLAAFKYVRDYVLKSYVDNEPVKEAELSNFSTFKDFEQQFTQVYPYFYADGMFMTLDYPDFRTNYNTINQILLNASFYSGQVSYYAIKDPNDANRFVFLCDSRLSTSKLKNVFYHCPGSHYDIKDSDQIFDIGHDDVHGYKLNKYNTRFVEIKATNDETNEYEVIGYTFVEYETTTVIDSYRPILINEILILSASSLAVIILYAIISYFLFVKNINKLNKAATEIASNLESNKPFEVIKSKVSSHDEMKNLSDSFEAMENQLVNYIEIIKTDAREKEKINAELEVASKIQLESLPKATFDNSQVSIRTFIKPAKEVGGDFYDYFYINEDELAIIISDVSGKGIPASLFMMKSKELIKSKLLNGLDLATATKEANDVLCENNDASLFVTSFIGVINFAKAEIRYVNAGHEKPYIISKNKVIKLDGISNFVLGGVEDLTFVEEKHAFHKGDMIFMFTDGLNESINDKEEEFSYQRIEETLSNSSNGHLDGYIEKMKEELANFVGQQEAFDDVTMVVARFNNDSLSLSYDKKDMSIIEDAVDTFNDHFSYIDEEKRSKVGIILDELLNNLVAYEEREDLVIDIKFSLKGEDLKITIISNGHDYNPFASNKEKYLEGFSHNIEEGGFGVTLVETLSKNIKYEYKNNHSHVEIEL